MTTGFYKSGISFKLPLLQVFMSAFNATPFGQAHLYLPPGASKQRWLQPPFFTRQGGLSTAEAEKNEIMSVFEGSVYTLVHFSSSTAYLVI